MGILKITCYRFVVITFSEETGCTVKGVVFAVIWLKTYLVDICWTWKTPILNAYGVWLRPNRLPRPLSGIVVCMVYHPPGLPAEDHRSLNEYVINTIDFLRNKYPDYGVVVLGDFNDFDISQLLSTHNLKQVVQLPTRGSAILDLIVTNLRNKYMSPRILAPLG